MPITTAHNDNNKKLYWFSIDHDACVAGYKQRTGQSATSGPQVSKGSVAPQLHLHFRNQLWECGLKSCSPRMVIKPAPPNERQSSLPLDLRGSLKGLILKVRNSESVTHFRDQFLRLQYWGGAKVQTEIAHVHL